MGRTLTSPQMKLLNKLEEDWFGDYIMCDQWAMLAALEPSAILKSEDHSVTSLHRQLLTALLKL